MARKPGAELVYDTARNFKERCLTLGTSLLWPDTKAWTEDYLQAFRLAFVENPDESKRSFLTKLKDQLATQPPAVHMVAADLYAFYQLFPSRVTAQKKTGSIVTIASWANIETNLDRAVLETFTQAIGHPGTWYQAKPYLQLEYFLRFSQRAQAEHQVLDDPKLCQELADSVLGEMRGTGVSARHVLLHLLFPEQFERIASGRQKRKIVEAFKDYVHDGDDLDESIRSIRKSLARRFGESFDFYDAPVRSIWQPNDATPEPDAERRIGWRRQ
jgi:5-methylcytosine-specific restriction enzyme B